MRNDLIIVAVLTETSQWGVNFIVPLLISGIELGCSYLNNDVVWKKVYQTKFCASNKMTDFRIFHDVMPYVGINIIHRGESSINISYQKLILFPSLSFHHVEVLLLHALRKFVLFLRYLGFVKTHISFG